MQCRCEMTLNSTFSVTKIAKCLVFWKMRVWDVYYALPGLGVGRSKKTYITHIWVCSTSTTHNRYQPPTSMRYIFLTALSLERHMWRNQGVILIHQRYHCTSMFQMPHTANVDQTQPFRCRIAYLWARINIDVLYITNRKCFFGSILNRNKVVKEWSVAEGVLITAE